MAPHLLAEAREQALWIGIRHIECETNELKDPGYNENPEDRCFACKKELHTHLKVIAQASQGSQVIDGVNHDDLADYRPGIAAAKKAGVISPLADLGISKIGVRKISKALGFPWWEKPAQPCLSSRFPYGQMISSELLSKVNKAESWLRKNGFPISRVRVQGLSASIELPSERIDDFLHNINRKEIVDYFLKLGFNTVTLDLEGLISGKLNRSIKIRSKK